jgi:hypothetical protein
VIEDPMVAGERSNLERVNEDPWIKLARDANSRSTNYFDNNYRKVWEDDLRMFQSKHPRDSKYNADAYKFRSRVFRPKSRAVVRKNEATAALAFFSNPDVVSIDPVNDEDQGQAWGALVMKELLNYRLTKTIPWFLTVIGGFQDAMTIGIVASLQTWRFRQKMEEREFEGFHPLLGEVKIKREVPKVIEDRPDITLIPVENIRFDPAAHWYDVVGTSPYVIIHMPMYVNDVLDRMESEERDGKGWKKYDKKTILQARMSDTDPLRQSRNDNREDAEAQHSEVNEFDVVMVHLNFIKSGDITYGYYTLRDTHLLTNPVPVQEMFLHCTDGRPPVQIGFSVIETHKPVPTSLIGLTRELQREANEIANQRLDNVKFVLNKRWLIRRGANIDVESLLRNVPGGVTMVNDVERDALPVNWNDVTSSSYQEQDRVNVDFDELAGNFAQGSVMTNRKLNETVGGMRIMAQGANMLTEYGLRVYVETWVEPVLRQLVKMEQSYETDMTVLALAGQKSGFFQKFGMNAQMDQLLAQELTVSVNVGMGATDPDTRLQRFMQATALYNQISMQGSPDQNLPEMRKTIFGLAGFKDSARFFKKEVDPQIVKATQMLQQAEAQAKQIVDQAKEALNRRERSLDEREHKMDMELLEAKQEFGADVQKARQEFAIAIQESRVEQELDVQEADLKMKLERVKAAEQSRIQRDKANLDAAVKVFQAHLDASLKKMQAEVDRKVAAASAPKKRTATKKGAGQWEITEH